MPVLVNTVGVLMFIVWVSIRFQC